jgi:hypothetical protein
VFESKAGNINFYKSIIIGLTDYDGNYITVEFAPKNSLKEFNIYLMYKKVEDITKNCTEIKLKSQLVNKQISINAIKPIKTRFNDSYLCFNKKYNNDEYFIISNYN